MGSTLASYFVSYDPYSIAHFYIKDMEPDIPVCFNNYKVTDNELLHKVFHPFSGRVGGSALFNESGNSKDTRSSKLGTSNKRYFVLLMRNALWRTRLWFNKDFKNWISSFSPEVILIQPGDFSYLLDIAVLLSKKYGIPLLVHESESYYLRFKAKPSFIHLGFLRSYERMMHRASFCVYLHNALEKDYKKYFDVPSATIMKGTTVVPHMSKKHFDLNNVRFIYGGNLGRKVGRCVPLVEIGQIIKKLGYFIDVYTNSKGDHMDDLTIENGILLHESIPYESLQKEIANSDFIIHIENQSPEMVNELEYAFTTKIPDMLASGVCSIVYGSSKIAAIRYFKDNSLGCVIENYEDLEPMIGRIINDKILRDYYINNALEKAKNEHNISNNSKRMRDIIFHSCSRQK